MSRSTVTRLVVAGLLTAAVLLAWAATGRHAYTKYEVIAKERVEIPKDDPLAEAGFYDGDSEERTVRRDEFHLGIFPTASGLIDKHIVSVVTILVPIWVLVGFLSWRSRRSGRSLP